MANCLSNLSYFANLAYIRVFIKNGLKTKRMKISDSDSFPLSWTGKGPYVRTHVSILYFNSAKAQVFTPK
jgi:hypothetical protein